MRFKYRRFQKILGTEVQGCAEERQNFWGILISCVQKSESIERKDAFLGNIMTPCSCDRTMKRKVSGDVLHIVMNNHRFEFVRSWTLANVKGFWRASLSECCG